jgi:O-antigen ligase
VGQPNHLAFLLIVGLIILERVWSGATELAAQSRSLAWVIKPQSVCVLAYILLIAALSTTQSRMGFACACVCSLVWLWTWRVRPRAITCALILLPALLLLTDVGLRELAALTAEKTSTEATENRLLSTEHSRASMWKHAAQIVAQKPWFGWGWRETRYAQVESFPASAHFEAFDHADNLFLELAISFGVPIAALALLLLLYVFIRFKPWQETNPNRVAAWLVLACLFAYSMVEFPLWYLHFMSLTGLVVGYLCAEHIQQHQSQLPSPNNWISMKTRAWICIGLLSTSLLGILDFQWASRAFGSSKLWPTGTEGSDPHLVEAQRTVLFGAYTGFAILAAPTRKYLTNEQVIFYGEQALHVAPEPRLLIPLIDAHQKSGNTERAKYLTDRLLRQFPDVQSKPVSSVSPVQ